MRRSLSLATLLGLRRGVAGGTATEAAPPARPPGALVWVHSPDPARYGVVTALAEALDAGHGGPHLLVTMPDAASLPAPTFPGVTQVACPAEMQHRIRAFLGHWQPNLLIWLGGAFRPVLLSATDVPRIPRILADAGLMPLVPDTGRWIPGAAATLLNRFDLALAVNAEAAQRLRRGGLPDARIEVTGPLTTMPTVLTCNERDRRDMTQIIGPRPLWLAAEVVPEELDAVIEAHRLASRRAHRLLLVLVPRDPDMAAGFAGSLRDAGLTIACRADGEDPQEATNVYLADQPAEMGLWLRLAPIAFLGGTLHGDGGRHPFEAAALGAVVIHGPLTAPQADGYLRLSRAGASRAVRNGQDLGLAVEAMLQPDRTAMMAHAAWDTITSGAEVCNRLAQLVRDALDRARTGP